MTNFKTLAFSGLVLSLAATGWAYGQVPATPPAAAPGTASPADEPDVVPSMDEDDLDAGGDDLDGASSDETAPDDASSSADAGPASRPGRMGRMDPNGNGAIEKDEFQGPRAERLREADANGDGTLSTAELEAMILNRIAERRAARLAKRLDIDGDGRVTLAEIESMRAKRFALYDLNDDGRIDGRELAALHRGSGHGEMRRGDRNERPSAHGRHADRHGRHGGEGWGGEGWGEGGRERHHGWDRMPRRERGYE